MIVEYLRYTIAPDQQDTFLAAYEGAMEPLLRSPFSRAFELCQCVEDPSQFILRLEWTSAEDHLQRFRSSPEFREFFALIKPYVSMIDEMRHYEQQLSG